MKEEAPDGGSSPGRASAAPLVLWGHSSLGDWSGNGAE